MSAELQVAGDGHGAAACEQELAARLDGAFDEAALCQEADERWASQAVAVDGEPLRALAAAQRRTARLLRDLSQRRPSPRLRRRARRASRAADDRELQARLEDLFGRRGVGAIETASFLLLALVLTLLLVESAVPLSADAAAALHWVDGLACLFFILEFAVKLAMAPDRLSWFWRNALTDLLPAIPAALFLLPVPALPGAAEDAVVLRLLRLLRVTWAARYVQSLRPLLRGFRLVLMTVRGLDGLVRRFRPLLDRSFVFLVGKRSGSAAVEGRRDLAFAALVRERELWSALPAGSKAEALLARMAELAAELPELPALWSQLDQSWRRREVAVEDACETLWSLQPHDLGRHLRPGDVRTLDRVARVLSAPPFCYLPMLRGLCVRGPFESPQERVVAFARRVADGLMSWQERMQFFADLHGIVTGPQILDRVASAMVKASQRPAVRLLLFGGLFSVLSLFWRENCLSKVVGLPLLLLGSFCLVFLALGWWLKRIAGEASETFRLTSEANFVSLLGLQKRRHEGEDLEFLARRTLGDVAGADGKALLHSQLRSLRAGVPLDVPGHDARAEALASRVGLVYQHFLDGALLHESDVKTTEQLLANLALTNLRQVHMGFSRKDRKRLRALRLDDGSILRGPYMWFRFITESVAVEASKRILEYNRRCPPLVRRAQMPAAERAELERWLESRRRQVPDRSIGRMEPQGRQGFATTEFHALHFLTADPERDAHVAATFGEDVLAALQADRRAMIRAIFGMRARAQDEGPERRVNFWEVYWGRLSHGRIFLLPLLLPARALRTAALLASRIRGIVREVLEPELAMQRREEPVATFEVALRKIHRMKAPGLLEAMRMRLCVDPAYSGAPCSWSGAAKDPARTTELEQDLDFLHLHERERASFLREAAQNRERVRLLHAARWWLPELGDPGLTQTQRLDGELAATAAFMADRGRVRTLLGAEAWRAEELPALLAQPCTVGMARRLAGRLVAALFEGPTRRWLDLVGQRTDARGRANLRQAYAADPAVRARIDAWNALPRGTGPAQAAVDLLRQAFAEGAELRAELTTLRAVQSLSALDVRNYRAMVFELGGYAEEGEAAAAALRLP